MQACCWNIIFETYNKVEKVHSGAINIVVSRTSVASHAVGSQEITTDSHLFTAM